jgi:hypothetical protein
MFLYACSFVLLEVIMVAIILDLIDHLLWQVLFVVESVPESMEL